MRQRVLLVLSLLMIPTILSQAALAGTETEHLLLSVTQAPLSEPATRALESMGIQVLDQFPASDTVLVHAPSRSMASIASLPFVLGVQADAPVEPLLDSSRVAAGLPDALTNAGLTGENVTIALLDGGIDQDHPGLRDRVLADLSVSKDGVRENAATTSQHGTHVAGILVGTGEGSGDAQLRGVAPGANLVSLDLSDQFTTSNALRAFEWIYENHEEYDIRVVANSWGRQREPATYDASDPLIRASDALVEAGIVVVFSAGNGGDVPGRMTLEATNPNVITVGAVTDQGRVEAYSSRGPIMDGDEEATWYKPDLVAPGTRVISTRSDGGPGAYYKMMNGTSMAAPHVAGAAALLLSVRPDLTPSQVKGLFTESARDVERPGPDHETGYGMLDVRAALALLETSEPRVVKHTNVVVERDGRLSGPSQAGGLLQVASMNSKEAFSFQVRENASVLTVQVTWDGNSPVKAVLEGPHGRTARATVEDRHTFELEAPEPGLWRMTLSSKGLGSGSYATEGTVTWEETLGGSGIPVDSLVRRSSGGFPSTGATGPFGPSPIPGVPMIVPMLAGGALTVVFAVGRLAWKRREN